MYRRLLDISGALARRSVFLFGARQTGKSTLLKSRYPEARYVDLLAADTFRELSSAPERLRQSLKTDDKLVIVDEVQKLPALLDEIQLMIEADKSRRFILTGSSARKLKRGNANLFGGRSLTFHLFPLTWRETSPEQLMRRLRFGSIPSILDSSDPWTDLREYVGVYLQEEIRAESLTRSIEAFSRFLTMAGLTNGMQLNFTKVGNDAQVPPRTVREYFAVLEDTLIGFQLPPFQKTRSRKPVATPKFYFFDVGVAHALQGIKEVPEGTDQFGRAVEHLVATELRAYLSYQRREEPLTYWRSTSQMEVDFVIGETIAIEVKGTGRVSPRDTKGLVALGEEITLKRKIIVCGEERRRQLDAEIEAIPFREFFDELWDGNLLNSFEN